VREGLDGPDRVLLDPNTASAGGTIALDWWYPSLDGGLRGGATPSMPGVLWTTVDVPVLGTRQRPTA
jgi:hypothetical protein